MRRDLAQSAQLQLGVKAARATAKNRAFDGLEQTQAAVFLPLSDLFSSNDSETRCNSESGMESRQRARSLPWTMLTNSLWAIYLNM